MINEDNFHNLNGESRINKVRQINFLTVLPLGIFWSLKFGVGVVYEFLLINLVRVRHCRTHCKTHSRRITRRISRATGGYTPRINFDRSTGRLAGGKHKRPLSEKFRWDLVIVDAEWLREGCALTGNLNSVFLPWESGLELHVFLY